jgi:hypothetical protein
MPSVRALAIAKVEASEQLSRSLSFTAKQHGYSLRPSWATAKHPRVHVAEGDLAILYEFLDVRQVWSSLWVR